MLEDTCYERRYPRGMKIFGEGELTECVYHILSGAVRTYKLLSQGRRQINAFHLPGDLFGLENGESHRFSADAIDETNVLITRRSDLLESMASRSDSTTDLLGLLTQNLEHAENHMLLLGRKNSMEKVAAFILEIDRRLAHPKEMILPMSRGDIADYLGLTLETVSRSLSVLRDHKLVRVDGPMLRQIVLLDRKGLRQIDT